jgi:hypothetical protein
MSKRIGLAIVAAGLMLSLSGVANAAVVTRAHTSRTVVNQNVRTGKVTGRHIHHRNVHHRRVVNVPHAKSSLQNAVAHRSGRHFNSRHVTVRRWNV